MPKKTSRPATKRSIPSEKTIGCLTCKFGEFDTDIPQLGECRFNPPRAVFSKERSTFNRHFVAVRFNDWCGKMCTVVPQDLDEKLEKLRPFLSGEQLYVEAKKVFSAGGVVEGLRLLEQPYQQGIIKSTMMRRIQKTLNELPDVDLEKAELRDLVETWRHRFGETDETPRSEQM